jgi:glycosyltransferase involved in cell wall biosynthesis
VSAPDAQPRTVAIDYRMCRASGIGVYLRNLVTRLVRDYSTEFRLVLIGGDPVPGAEHRECRAPIYSVRELIDLPLRIPRDADIMWAPSHNAPFVSPGKLVVTIHDVNHLALPELLRSSIKRAYARAMFANVRRRAAAVICVSDFTAREAAALAGIGRDRSVVIHSGIDDAWRSGESTPAPMAEPYLLYVGNVKPHKNLVRLLGALQSIHDRIPHRLVVVGKREGFITPDRGIATAVAPLGDRVVFTGEISDAELRSYYDAAAMLVYPSLYEGFGFPPLEAMARGVPVAASNAASIPEICGNAVRYFDPRSTASIAEAILAVVEDPIESNRLRQAGAEHVATYSWDRSAASLAGVFRTVLAKSR